MSTGLETMPLPLPGLDVPRIDAAPRTAPAAPAEPPAPRERFLAAVKDALPGGFVMSRKAWDLIALAGDEYQAAGIERWARKPGGLGRQR